MNTIQLIVTEDIERYQARLNDVLSEDNAAKYTDIERSEAHERLGIVQYYHGNFADSLKNLEAALRPKYMEHKLPRNILYINIMLASLYCRFGHFDRSENLLSYSIQMSESMTTASDFVPTLLSNLAIIYLHQKKEKDCVLKAREALISAGQLYPKNSSDYLGHVRVLLAIYLKLRQYDKAESLLSESAFIDIERTIILAGIRYASGDSEEAYTLLEAQQYNLTSEANAVLRKNEQDRRIQQMAEDTSIANYRKSEEAIRADEEFHSAILLAMLHYNMSVIGQTPTADFNSALQAMEAFVTSLRMKRYELHGQAKFNSQLMERYKTSDGGLTAPVDLYNDPYADCAWDAHPNYMSFDAYFYPVTMLSTLLAIKAEKTLLTSKFLKGYEVAAGEVPTDMNKLNSLMKEIDAQYKESVSSIGLTLLDEEPSAVTNGSSDEVLDMPNFQPLKKTGGDRDDLSVVAEDVNEELDAGAAGPATALTPAAAAPPPPEMNDSLVSILDEDTLAEPKESDYPDLSLLKDAVQSYQLMSKMQTGEHINSSVVKASSETLMSAYHINISNTTGQIIPPAHAAPTSDKNKKASAAANKGRRASVNTKDDVSSVGGGHSRRSSVGGKDSSSVMSVDSNVTPLDKPRPPLEPYAYVAEKLDQTSMRSEIMVLLNKFGRDEASTWIQWALSSCGGISLGFLGANIPNAQELIGFGKIDKNAMAPPPVLDGVALPDQFTHEVRKRLLQVDSQLQPVFNGLETAYEIGVLEARALVMFILCKVTVQLNMKEDASAWVLQLESLTDLLHKKYRNNESATYLALACKFRFEFTEWCTPASLENEKLLTHLIMTMLPMAKKYLKSVETIQDIYIRRDAYKKIITVYTEIGRIPQLSGNIRWATVTMEQLEEHSPELIESNELNNFEWLQQYGKFRARQHFLLMKALDVDPSVSNKGGGASFSASVAAEEPVATATAATAVTEEPQ